jgi:hypothetical protein
MKKVLLGLVIVVVVIAGGAVFLFSNLDKIVKTGIETAGTSTLGTRVSVGDVALDLVAGTASIYNFAVANPAGYTSGDMLRFSELSVGINLQDTSGERVHINSVVARSPYVFYESIDGTSNMDAISARFDTQETEESESQVMLVIDSIVIEDIQGTLQSDKLPSALNVDLGDIRLSELEGYPEDLAGQIMGPLLSQVAASSAQAIVKATTELLNDAAGKVGDQLGESLDDVGDKANEALDKVGNLFKRN